MKLPKIPEIAVIIPWCNRPELAITLKANASIFLRPTLEVIIVNCAGNSRVLRKLLPNVISAKARIVTLPANRFNKSLALNIGSYLASADVLFFLDADIVLKTFVIKKGEGRVRTRKSFITVQSVEESKRFVRKGNLRLKSISYTISLVSSVGGTAQIDASRIDLTKRTRSAPGLIMLRKHDFIGIDGMNSKLQGWGWEDLDLPLRLQFRLNLKHREAWTAIHLTHGDASRNILLGKRGDENRNASICLANYHMGNFSGTYTKDIRRWKSRIVLRRES
jgi:glycosyltransferase involved in cell wall biosynthesis